MRIVHVPVSNPGKLRETLYGSPCQEAAWLKVRKSTGNMAKRSLKRKAKAKKKVKRKSNLEKAKIPKDRCVDD